MIIMEKNGFGFIKKAISGILSIAVIFTSMSVNVSAANINPAKAKIKVACVGDSITEGSRSNVGGYPKFLRDIMGTDKYLINNYGVGGTTTLFKGLSGGTSPSPWAYKDRPQYTQSKEFLPDIVIFMLGTNDSKDQNWIHKNEYKDNYKALIQSYIDLPSKPIVIACTSPVVFYDWDTESRLASNDHITDAVVSGEIVPIQKEVINELGIRMIDINQFTREKMQELGVNAITADGVHPNDTGYQLIAEKISETLKEIEATLDLETIVDEIPEGFVQPQPGDKYLNVPVSPAGYKIEIKSTDKPDVINTEGIITPQDSETKVMVTFKVTKLSDLSTGESLVEVTVPRSGFSELTGAAADEMSSELSLNTAGYVDNISNQSYITFRNVGLGKKGSRSFKLKFDYNKESCAENASCEVRIGSNQGTLLANVNLNTKDASWSQDVLGFETKEVYFKNTLTSTNDIVLVFKGDAGKNICRFYSVQFGGKYEYIKLEAENYSSSTSAQNQYKPSDPVLKIESGGSGKDIGGSFDGAWLAYDNVDFSGAGLASVAVSYSHNPSKCSSDARLEFRLDNVDGELFATINLPTTGGWNTYKTAWAAPSANVQGKHKVYVVFRGTPSTSYPHVANLDYFEFNSVADKEQLKNNIKEAEKVARLDYTPDTYANLVSQIESAKKAVNRASILQDDVNYENYMLTEALSALSPSVKVSSIEFSQPAVNLEKSTSLQLSVIVKPQNASYKDVTWSSSDSSVARVDANGLVTANKNGTAKIYATSNDGSNIKAECIVTVYTKLKNISLKASKKWVEVGKKLTLNASILPADASDKIVKWTTSNKKIATVTNGVVKGIKPGKVTITAISSKGITAKISLKVMSKPSKVIFKKKIFEVNKGKKLNLNRASVITILPDKKYRISAKLKWYSSNTKYASVTKNGGVVKGKAKGKKVKITVKLGKQIIGTVYVKVI